MKNINLQLFQVAILVGSLGNGLASAEQLPKGIGRELPAVEVVVEVRKDPLPANAKTQSTRAKQVASTSGPTTAKQTIAKRSTAASSIARSKPATKHALAKADATPVNVPCLEEHVPDCPDCPPFKMCILPKGSFQVPSRKFPLGELGRDARMYIYNAFAIGQTEVTQGLWLAVMRANSKELQVNNPSRFPECGKDCPIESVTYDEIETFITSLNRMTGRKYRLPDEPEWQYACAAGKMHKYCGSDEADEVAWTSSNSGARTHPVARKHANAWGLYDMSGNTDEFIGGCATSHYADPVVMLDCSKRMIRGSSYADAPEDSLSSYRRSIAVAAIGGHRLVERLVGNGIGFRLVHDTPYTNHETKAAGSQAAAFLDLAQALRTTGTGLPSSNAVAGKLAKEGQASVTAAILAPAPSKAASPATQPDAHEALARPVK